MIVKLMQWWQNSIALSFDPFINLPYCNSSLDYIPDTGMFTIADYSI